MKVTRKMIYAQNDCFEATEDDVTVSIRRQRHRIVIESTLGSKTTQAEVNLAEFAYLLRMAGTLRHQA